MKKHRWLLPWLLLAPLWGQDQTPATGPESPAAPRSVSGNSQKPAKGTSNDRLFFTLPNFLTLENAEDAPPLSAGEKFKVTARGSFDPVEMVWYGALAGIGQAENSESAFGQGAAGYAKRYGERFADGTIENFTARAVLPSLLHQDPRYFQMGKGGFWHRVFYAADRVVVTRSDSGNTQFNVSEIGGSAIAAAISTYSYHPRPDRNMENMLHVWSSQVGYDVLSYVVKEFWPDIHRKLRRNKAANQALRTPAPMGPSAAGAGL